MAVDYWRKGGEQDRKSLWVRAGKTCKAGVRATAFLKNLEFSQSRGTVPCMVAGAKYRRVLSSGGSGFYRIAASCSWTASRLSSAGVPLTY
jgi:hypothetical protein